MCSPVHTQTHTMLTHTDTHTHAHACTRMYAHMPHRCCAAQHTVPIKQSRPPARRQAVRRRTRIYKTKQRCNIRQQHQAALSPEHRAIIYLRRNLGSLFASMRFNTALCPRPRCFPASGQCPLPQLMPQQGQACLLAHDGPTCAAGVCASQRQVPYCSAITAAPPYFEAYPSFQNSGAKAACRPWSSLQLRLRQIAMPREHLLEFSEYTLKERAPKRQHAPWPASLLNHARLKRTRK